MMFTSLSRQARGLSSRSLSDPLSATDWQATLPERRKMWLDMLGLWPLPERTPLKVTVTGSLERDGYIVEKVHFQSVPGAYVCGNLYRPARQAGRSPAILYLCGHCSEGKAYPAYQANPRWFAQHGYVALVLDTIEIGESAGNHHGTHSLGRWDWHSRGYTPAGVEVWNAMRAFDYLASRADVDKKRMGVTGLSGGGAISWFVGAADERVRCVVPVCQTGSIEQVVADRATDGHCDCAFWINYHRWCTPDIGALIAPRPLLIAAGTEDVLWRPYAFRDVFHRIHRQYAALGKADSAQLVEDLTPHGYTPKLRKAILEWFNLHLKDEAQPVDDDVTEYVEPEKNLLVFGGHPPRNDEMRIIDRTFVKRAALPAVSTRAQWTRHQHQALNALRQRPFRYLSTEATPAAAEYRNDGAHEGIGRLSSHVFQTADDLTLRVRVVRPPAMPRCPVLAFALSETARSGHFFAERPKVSEGIGTACIEVRNTASTSTGPGYGWTLRRSYPLLGHTLPERQVQDLLAGMDITRRYSPSGPIALYGEGRTAVLAIYAAVLDPGVSEVVLANPPASHEDPETPEFLGILRVGDLPHNLALLWPRPITFIGNIPPAYRWTEKLYERFGAGHLLRRLGSVRDWKPCDL